MILGSDESALRFAIGYLSGRPLTAEENIVALKQSSSNVGDHLYENYRKNLTPAGVSEFRKWAADFIEHMNGNYGQDRILRRIIQRFIQDEEPLPPELRDYVEREPVAKPVKTKRGPDPRKKALRDAAIVRCIAEVRDRFGHKVSRNEGSRDDGAMSACAIVSKALAVLKHAMSEDNVEKIWRDRAKIPNF